MEALAKTSGVLLVLIACFQMTQFLYQMITRKIAAGRLDKEFLQLLKEFAASNSSGSRSPRRERIQAWPGKRAFRVDRREYETPDREICSFYLSPADEKPVADFLPGQFLTFDFSIPGQAQAVTRCYSLSDILAQENQYRITVKKMRAPPESATVVPSGLSSTHLLDTVRVGDVVETYAPAGSFCLDVKSSRPVVLIAGGVGITPLLAMLNWMLATGSKRQVWLFYGVPNRNSHALCAYLRAKSRGHDNFRMVVFYSDPTPDCVIGSDYDVAGPVRVEHMKPLLPERNYEFYVCGPPVMMKTVTEDLKLWGVPGQDILTEAFSSVSSVPRTRRRIPPPANARGALSVTFARSSKTVEWKPEMGSLLQLAEASGIKPNCACRMGNCGTCATPLLEGNVEYSRQPQQYPKAGACLLCVSRPKTSMVLDL